MKNPFPGMNPYLELDWRDVHTRLVVYICDAVQAALPTGLRAKVEEDITIDTGDGELKHLRPDVYVRGERDAQVSRPTVTRAATATEPRIVTLDQPLPMRHIEIIDAANSDQVITAIELLSLTNKKPGNDRKLDQAKQRSYVAAGINLVEIDLLRGGERAMMFPSQRYSDSTNSTYLISVNRMYMSSKCEVYRAPLRETLPILSIPLRPSDQDVALDLQSLIDLYHERSGIGLSEYQRELDPPLSEVDAAWAASLLAALPKS